MGEDVGHICTDLSRDPVEWLRDVFGVELWYPGIGNNPTTIQVGLLHVRAADDIRIKYDFERDGWVIQQASVFEWEANDNVMDEDWQEVAFVRAWARERERLQERDRP